MGEPRVVHCWQGRREDITERFGFGSDEWAATYAEDWQDGTCMLLEDHEGPHEFTPDDQIGVTFAPAETADGLADVRAALPEGETCTDEEARAFLAAEGAKLGDGEPFSDAPTYDTEPCSHPGCELCLCPCGLPRSDAYHTPEQRAACREAFGKGDAGG